MKDINVEVSARHVHLNREAVDILFGNGYSLKPKKSLSQTGQFACEEKVSVVGPRATIKNVSVLGPERTNNQVEISKTDARAIGIEGVIKESGDLKGTPGCVLVGPNGELDIKEGVIVAKRHIHANETDAKDLSIEDGDVVCVDVKTSERSLIFKDVVVRVSKDYVLAMHIDTDEANAANIISGNKGKIVKI